MLIILDADSDNLLHTSLIPKSQSFSLSFNVIQFISHSRARSKLYYYYYYLN